MELSTSTKRRRKRVLGPPCSVPECGHASYARGLCSAHLYKLYTHGDPLGGSTRAANGSGSIDKDGYVRLCVGGISKVEHVRVAEKALGKPLPPSAVVHHVDEDKANNAPSNLVICPDNAYHMTLHQRMRAAAACGNPNWLKCCRCGKYGAPETFSNAKQPSHPACDKARREKYRKAAAWT